MYSKLKTNLQLPSIGRISRRLLLFATAIVLAVSPVDNYLHAQGQAVEQQKRSIKGQVVDDTGEPVIGASVVELGTSNGVITDYNGNFQITPKGDNPNFKISFIGLETMTLGVSKMSKIVLTTSANMLGEVIAVGYGSQKKESVVGSIAQVSGEMIKSRGTMSSMTDALSGSMPGVTVMTSTGMPGGGGLVEGGSASTILIRGMATWNNSAPLVLVDGVERSMNDVDINEVETFSVLKDASATAVFGVKGANGVILITTKQGMIGKPKVSVEANFAMKNISKIADVMPSYNGLLSNNYALVHELPLFDQTNWSFYTPERQLNYFRDGIDPEKYPSVNWKDEMTRNFAINHKYSVNVSGGTEFVKYFTSLSYIHDGDLLETNNHLRDYSPEFSYDRVNFRSNLDFSITKTTNFKVNLSGYHGIQQNPGINTGANVHLIYYGLYKYAPNHVPIYSDGTYSLDETRYDRMGNNSLFYLNTVGTYKQNRTSVTTDFDLTQKLDFITKGLSVKGKVSYDNYFTSVGRNVKDLAENYVRKIWNPLTEEWIVTIPPSGGAGFDYVMNPLEYTSEFLNDASANQTMRNMYYEAALSYSRSFGKHNVSGLALFSRQERTNGSNWTSKREDWVGRVTYDYDYRYLFEFNSAYNGSEKFGPDYKFDFFPSFAVGWRVSKEKFFSDNIKFISNLKLKYSLGWVGNDNLSGVGMWPYVTVWESVNKKPSFGYPSPQESTYYGYQEGAPGNPNIRWEKVRKQNYGVEFGLFNEKVTGAFDYFRDHRYDMLVGGEDRSMPDFFGTTAPAANIGIVDSQGVEIEVKYRSKIGKVDYWVSGNWTWSTNTIKYKEDPELKPYYQQSAGHSIGQNRTQVIDGLITSWNDYYTGVFYEQSSTNYNLLPGDFRMIDYNADGTINNSDAVPYGHCKYPRNTYGFTLGASYKGVSLNVQFYGVYNVNQNFMQMTEHDFRSPIVYQFLLDRTFTPEYKVGSPDYRALNMSRNSPIGNTFLMDGSFLRLKSAELGYVLPAKWTDKLSMDKVRVYVNGNNLFYWSKLPVDVEGVDFAINNYPTMRQVNLGINVTF